MLTAVLERQTHGVGVGHIAIEGLADGGLQLGGAIARQQPHQGGGDGSQIVAALAGTREQPLAGRCGLSQKVGRSVAAGGVLLLDQGRDVIAILDLGALVVTARMAGEDLLAVEDAHLVEIGEDGECAAHVTAGDRIVVEIEADIGCLADRDRHGLEQGIGIVRQLQQPGRLLGEDLANAEGLLIGTAPIGSQAVAPSLSLGIEVVEIDERAGGKEAVADITDGALDPALLIAARDGHGSGLEPIVSGELEEGGVKADGVSLALQHDALEIVVEEDPWHAVPGGEGADMAAQEALQACIEEEAEIDLAREARDHDEGHQRAAGASDGELTKMPPVDLPLLSGQGAQAQVGFGLRARAMAGDDMAKMIGAAAVAAFADHHEQPAGGQGGERLERLADKGQERIERGGTCGSTEARQTGLRQHPCNGTVMHMQLAGDGAGAPLLDVVIAQDPGFEIRRDGHGSNPLLRRRKPLRTSCGQRRPHQWQRHGGRGGASRRGSGGLGATTEPGASKPSVGGWSEP